MDFAGFGLIALLAALLNLAFFTGLVVLVVLGIRWLVKQDRYGAPSTRGGEDEALRILRERFARGEIDAAEYEERRRALNG